MDLPLATKSFIQNVLRRSRLLARPLSKQKCKIPSWPRSNMETKKNALPRTPNAHGRAAGLSDRDLPDRHPHQDRKSTRLNSSHSQISYAVFCLKKKKQ